jgi:hypothetical protein
VELFARRQHDFSVVGDPRLALHLLQPVETLRDDACGLAHLFHVHAVAVVHVAVLVHRNAKVHLVVCEVRLLAAEIPIDARRAQHGAGLRQRDRIVRAQQADSLRALEPDLVLIDELLVLVDCLWHARTKPLTLGIEAAWDVLSQTAGLEVPRVHPRAGDQLEEVEELLALPEAVPKHRDRSQLEPRSAKPHEV